MTFVRYCKLVATAPVAALALLFAIVVLLSLVGFVPPAGDDGLAWGTLLVFSLVAVVPPYVLFAALWLYWLRRAARAQVFIAVLSAPPVFALLWSGLAWMIATDPQEFVPLWSAVLLLGGYCYLAGAYGIWRALRSRERAAA